MVKIGNIYYFLYIFLFIIIIFGLYFVLKNKDKKTQYKILLYIAFGNFVLHFMKLLFEPYRSDMPGQIRFITFCNICAVTTLIMPWIYLYKKSKILNNYIYFIGVIGGLAALFYPTEAINESAFCFDTIRFYICHMSLAAIPILMAKLDIFKPDYKKAWSIPICFIIIEVIIFVNEIILVEIGLVDSTWEQFFDKDHRNTSFVFGPQTSFDSVMGIVKVFVPKILRTNIFGIINGVNFYWPVIWLIIPAFIYLPIVGLLIDMPFVYKNIKNDFNSWRLSRC